MPLPTVTVDPLKSVLGQKIYIKFTPLPTGTAASFLGQMVDYDCQVESIKREVIRAADGLIAPDRIVVTKQTEGLKFQIDDVKTLIDLFGSIGGSKQGTCEVWIVDPQDISTKCALHAAAFKCLATLDGGVKFSATEFSKATISFEATEKIVWAADFTIV